jgi:hypothetical protein
VIRTLDGAKNPGINRVMWNLTAGTGTGQGGVGSGRSTSVPVEPGVYLATLNANGKSVSRPVQVLQDMWLRER